MLINFFVPVKSS